MTSQKVICLLGQYQARFSITIEFLRWPMGTDPELIDRLNDGVFLLVRDDATSMPSGASANHMEDDRLVNEKEVTFNL